MVERPTTHRVATGSQRSVGGVSQPVCVHCGDAIDGKYVTYGIEGAEPVPLHGRCRHAYVMREALACDWCGLKMTDGYVRLTSERLTALVHEECCDGFTNADHLVACGSCKGVLTHTTGGVQVSREGEVPTALHPYCQQERHTAAARETCTHCALPVLDSLVQISDAHSYGVAKLHPKCVQPFKEANCPACVFCSERIFEAKYSLIRSRAYHDKCLRQMRP